MIMIRSMRAADTEAVLVMMQTFYTSPAVHTSGSEAIFRADIARCVEGDPYVEGFVFEDGDTLLGYAMLARSYSTEFGRHCIWLEDLYLTETARGLGLSTRFMAFLDERYPEAILRLEVEEENERAVHVYRKAGFDFLPYQEMVKTRD